MTLGKSMRVIVQTDYGLEVFSYSTEPDSFALHPGPNEGCMVIAALAEAITFLSPKLHDNGEPAPNIVAAIDATEKRGSHLRVVPDTAED